MEKNFGVYPEYPHVWDDNKSREDTEANEDREPGAPRRGVQSWDIEDAEFRMDNGHSAVTNGPIIVPPGTTTTVPGGIWRPQATT